MRSVRSSRPKHVRSVDERTWAVMSSFQQLGMGPQPLLLTLLDAMDGLTAEADVAFVLTTDRADLLEEALSQRPAGSTTTCCCPA